MKKNMLAKRIFSASVAILFLFGQAFSVGTASALSIPSPSSVMSDIEQRYHINSGSVQNFGESFNVSDTKKYAPELSLSFSPTDPKDGQKITAKAFPLYFANPTNQLYFTWFLKRKGGSDDVEDWKVAAMRILANDGADVNRFLPGPDDDDGYKAPYGGGDKTYVDNSWCYIKDPSSGIFYELGPLSSSPPSFGCGTAGYQAACINSTQNVATDGSSTSAYQVDGTPVCDGGAPFCPGTMLARCINPSVASGTFSLTDTVQRRVYPDTIDPITLVATPNYVYDPAVENNMSCQGNEAPRADKCMHLFPDATGYTTGDGKFATGEEKFWRTNPADPDTANNGNKDEANVVGLGRDTFTWNYQTGDQLGLVVEGSSLMSTKHDDSTMMIMWAFSGDGCRVEHTGSYNTTIKGYDVNIPTTSMGRDEFDKCLKDNLVDPLDTGQTNSKQLELDVSASPDNPTNDKSAEKSGDTLMAVAAITNSSRSNSEVTYEWKVEVSNDVNMSNPTDITGALKTAGLLPVNKGNGLNSISIPLNMDEGVLGAFASSNPIYMRLTSTATENFNTKGDRTGHSDVIVKVSNTDKKILAYKGTPSDTGTSVSLGDEICGTYIANPQTAQDAMTNLDRISCRVMKNEIIGLKVDNTAKELKDFSWQVDGKALVCDTSVSPNCTDGTTAFIAVTGEPGTVIDVKLDAVDATTGKAVTLTRMFNIVEPDIALESTDMSTVWPRYLGQYVGLDGSTNDDYSENFFEKSPESGIRMKAQFIPTFAGSLSTRQWLVNGYIEPESGAMEIDNTSTAGGSAGDVANVSLSAVLTQPVATRLALKNIWGIDATQSEEITISKSVQVTNISSATAADSGVKKFYAALSGYVPPAISFALRAILSGGLLLFTVGFVFSLIPEASADDERRR
ncbi:MAG: hypothetical protein WCJ25_03695 [Candidatus Moraniibacteriota bacterium]